MGQLEQCYSGESTLVASPDQAAHARGKHTGISGKQSPDRNTGTVVLLWCLSF